MNVNHDELGNLGLKPHEEEAIVEFLKTLSDGTAEPSGVASASDREREAPAPALGRALTRFPGVPAWAAVAPLAAPAPGAARAPTSPERVEAQRAIERIDYGAPDRRERSFEAAVPDDVSSAGFENASARRRPRNGLATPVTADDARRRAERIARRTLVPDRLRRGSWRRSDDPCSSASAWTGLCLSNGWRGATSTWDRRIHAEARRAAQRLRAALVRGEIDPSRDHPAPDRRCRPRRLRARRRFRGSRATGFLDCCSTTRTSPHGASDCRRRYGPARSSKSPTRSSSRSSSRTDLDRRACATYAVPKIGVGRLVGVDGAIARPAPAEADARRFRARRDRRGTGLPGGRRLAQRRPSTTSRCAPGAQRRLDRQRDRRSGADSTDATSTPARATTRSPTHGRRLSCRRAGGALLAHGGVDGNAHAGLGRQQRIGAQTRRPLRSRNRFLDTACRRRVRRRGDTSTPPSGPATRCWCGAAGRRAELVLGRRRRVRPGDERLAVRCDDERSRRALQPHRGVDRLRMVVWGGAEHRSARDRRALRPRRRFVVRR